MSRTFAALRVRNYRLFLSSQVVATTGLWMQRIAHGPVVDVDAFEPSAGLPRDEVVADFRTSALEVQADVQYFDVAGIAKGIAEKGMSGQLLGYLSQADALVHVVRAFNDPAVPHPSGSVDPARDGLQA